MVTWSLAIHTWWSLTWRQWLWTLGLNLLASPVLTNVPPVLRVPIAALVFLLEFGIIAWAMRRALERNLTGISGRLPWSRALLALGSYFWRALLMILAGTLVYTGLVQLAGPSDPESGGFGRLGTFFVFFLYIILTQWWAIRSMLRVQRPKIQPST